MKEAALEQVGASDWQTPHNGDFARYVEELTGGQAQVTLDEPGRVRRASERLGVPLAQAGDVARHDVRLPATAAGAAVRASAADMRTAASAVLDKVRLGLLLLTAVQIVLLAIFSLGSLVGVAVSLFFWWLVGRAKQLLREAGAVRQRQIEAVADARRHGAERSAEQGKGAPKA